MNQLIRVFKALSDDNRLKIVNYLKRGERSTCEILEKMNITKESFTQNLDVLTECELVLSREEGTYYLNQPVIKIIEAYFSSLKSMNK